MDINITEFFTTCTPSDYNPTELTFLKACADSPKNTLLTTFEQFDALITHLSNFEAWEREELISSPLIELNALFMQLIAGDMRAVDLDGDSDEDDWQAHQARAEIGVDPWNIQRCILGEIYYRLES